MTYLTRLTGSLLMLLFVMGSARAEEGTAKVTSADAVTIAVLDWRAALLGTDQARERFREIRASLSEDEQEIQTLADEAKAMQERLKSQAASLNADEKRQLSKEIQEKAEEYQFLGQRLRKEQRQQQEAYIRIARPQLDEAVRLVIKDRGIDLLLDRQAVTYVNKRLDITQDVILRLNRLQADSADDR